MADPDDRDPTHLYRFVFDVEGEHFEFFPDDPSASSDAAGAVINLTGAKGTYGLKARIEQASRS